MRREIAGGYFMRSKGGLGVNIEVLSPMRIQCLTQRNLQTTDLLQSRDFIAIRWLSWKSFWRSNRNNPGTSLVCKAGGR